MPAGRSTGSTLGEVPAADVPTRPFGLMQIEPDDLMMHVYRFDVSRDDQQDEYATIVELHHPEHLTAPQLVDIFGDSPSDALGPALVAGIARVAQF